MTILFVLLAIAGIALVVTGAAIKKKYRRILIILGSVMLAVGAVMVILTLYFAWAVRNDAPGPYDDTRVETEAT
ncbi:MAG: hypothetical protein J5570_03205 [Lachnospiraceae bacterium]|nr:hypothetical protein [Lachnospiraceae bacterium]